MKSALKQSKVINIGIGCVTGRENFKKLIKTYVNNWHQNGHIENANINIHIFIAYDLNYTGAQKSAFTSLEEEVYDSVKSINYIGEEETKNLIEELNNEGILTSEEGQLLFGDGYGKKRNLVLYSALVSKMDYLLFLDDDEYPVTPLNTFNDVISWSGQDVLGVHLNNISRCDITAGYHCGYISPIPYIDFNKAMPEETFRLFIDSISNDIINWDSIKTKLQNGKGITFGDIDVVLRKKTVDIKESQGGKWISGSNLCINLQTPDRIPPFYNPPGARGEDTFFSTLLSNLEVKRVSTYTFHDGFLKYSRMLSGVLPQDLKPVLSTDEMVIKRFLKASIGWIRYKPLLMYITNRGNYQSNIKQMKKNLQKSIPTICKYFKNNEFKDIIENLDKYDRNVVNHYEEFTKVIEIWNRLIKYKFQMFYNIDYKPKIV